MASGHYARVVQEKNNNDKLVNKTKNIKLMCASDPVKDQTLFLSALSQSQLRRILFPIGSYKKSEVRDLACKFNLSNKDQPDSQGLCFLGKVKFDAFLESYLGNQYGDIVDFVTGNVIGRHYGVSFHTVGQRKGIGKMLYPNATSNGPWYIVAKNPSLRVLLVSNMYHEDMFKDARSKFYVKNIRWIAENVPYLHRVDDKSELWYVGIKIRHGPTIVKGMLSLNYYVNEEEKESSATGNVYLIDKDSGLAPGQFVAFYRTDGSECLGCGVIS